MMTLPLLASVLLKRAQQCIRAEAFDEMQQMAAGWGLPGSYPAPQVKNAPTIDLHFSLQSRRTLFRGR